MWKFLLFYVFSFITINIVGQEFGEISEEWLKLTKFDEAPDADAIIIFDKASVRITRSFNQEFTRHVRIKVLKEEGKKYGDVKLRVSKNNEFYDLEAASYNTEGDEIELDEDNLFKEDQGSSYLYSFAIPGIELGSVIEYKYTILSEGIAKLPSWTFQNKDFTVLSEFNLTIPRGFVYDEVEVNLEKYDFSQLYNESRDAIYPDQIIGTYTWRCVNVPGLKKEPFIDSMKDELARLVFILKSYKDPWISYTFAKSWGDIAEKSYRFYDEYVEEKVDLNEELKEIFAEKDELTKTQKIYDYVRTNIKTLKDRKATSEELKKPSEILEDKEASAEEKNILLIALLNQAGIKSNIVLISTRSHGKIIPALKDPTQFNDLICEATIKNKKYYLNPANKANPFGCLPPNYNVGAGLTITSESGDIIKFRTLHQQHKGDITSTCRIEGSDLKVETKFQLKGYLAFYERNAVIDKDTTEHIEKKLKDIYELAELDTFCYKNLDSLDKPLELVINYTLPDFVEQSDDMLYISVPMFSSLSSNPLEREKRYFPICYDSKEYIREKCRIELPENLGLVELPPNVKKSIHDYSFRRSYSSRNGYIEAVRTKNIKRRIIDLRQYRRLKALYDDIVSADQEQIVLRVNATN